MEFKREKADQCDARAIYMYQCLLLLHEGVPVGLKEMGTEQKLQMLRSVIAMTLYCLKHEHVYHMLRLVLVDRKL